MSFRALKVKSTTVIYRDFTSDKSLHQLAVTIGEWVSFKVAGIFDNVRRRSDAGLSSDTVAVEPDCNRCHGAAKQARYTAVAVATVTVLLCCGRELSCSRRTLAQTCTVS